MAKPRLLLTGASGFLGYNIYQQAKAKYDVLGIVNQHTVLWPQMQQIKLNLLQATGLRNIVRETRPHAIIHTAYISDINYCQTHPKETNALNIDTPILLAKLAAEMGIPYVFTSSDMVFDGAKNAPYVETDAINPLNHYGWQKATAEAGIIQAYAEAAVCRMPLMYGAAGPGSKNYFMPQLQQLRNGQPIPLFVDEYRTPLGGLSAARGLLLALHAFSGVYHLGGAERASRYELGLLLAEVAGIKLPNIVPTYQQDVAMPAPRPKDVALDSSKAISQGFKPLPNAAEMAQILGSLSLP